LLSLAPKDEISIVRQPGSGAVTGAWEGEKTMNQKTSRHEKWSDDRAQVAGWLAFGLAMALASVLWVIPTPESAMPTASALESGEQAAPSLPTQTSNAASAQADDSSQAADRLIVSKLRRPGSGLSEAEAAEVARVIVEEAERHQFEPALVMAVIHVESSGRTLAVSPVGALGLMQIMPPTGQELAERHGIPWSGPDTLLDPVVNVKLGVAYLRKLADRYQDVSTALTAYNWGPGRIDRKLRSGQELPTLYRDRVMRAYDSARQEIAVGRS